MLTHHHITRLFAAALTVVLFLLPARAADTLRVTFVGDVLLDRGVRERIDSAGPDALFSPSADSLLRSSHFVVANLECPATHIVAPVQKKYIFRGDPEHLATLRRHGITHLDLANNHSIDQGRAGLVDTWRNVTAAGIIPFGAGNTMSEAAEPLVIRAAGDPGLSPQASTPSCLSPQNGDLRNIYVVPTLRLALENFSYLTGKPCVSQEPEDSLVARIHGIRDKDPSAVIVVCPHWGAEHALRPLALQKRLDRMIDAGADIIIGHHTHTWQTVEEYQGKHIYYSIGNFIFDQHKAINTRACVVKVTVDADSVKAETIAVEIRQCVPHICKTE